MDFQSLFNLVLGGAFVGIGGIAKAMWDGQQKLRDEIILIHLTLTRDYVPNSRFDAVLKEIGDDIRYIRNKLDEKSDK